MKAVTLFGRKAGKEGVMAVKTYRVPKLAISLFSLILSISTTAHAKIIYVDDDGPADFNNIQAAIDDSNDGDTIIVNPGAYTGDGNRDILFNGKAITVRSIKPSDPNIVASTIIDCNGTEAEPHRGFVFQNKENRNSVLSGLTITNGQCHQGGSVCINQCSCQITKCRFISNRANCGGGLWCGGWPELTKPLITNCIFVNNEAAWGGGMEIFESSRPTVMNCIFRNNHAISYGGGIYNYRALPIIIGCKFENNSAGTPNVIGGGGGLYAHTWYDPIPTLMPW
jgi:hypothetical protein